MSKNNKNIVISYYARLIHKGKYTMDMVPQADQQAVLEKIEELKKQEQK